MLSVLIVQATIQFALAILAEAALSYLGLGTQPPQPSWGRMLAEAQTLRHCWRCSPVWPSRWPCWGSTYSVTVFAMCWTHDWPESAEWPC